MTVDRDTYEREQELTRTIEQALADLRQDVESLVADEVERRGYPRAQVEKLVAEMVRKELRSQRRSMEPVIHRWMPTIAAVGVVLLLFAGWLGWGALRGPDTPSDPVRTAAAAGGAPDTADPAAETPSAGATSDEPADEPEMLAAPERAARYDSLLVARSPALEPLVSRLERAEPSATVTAAIAAWRQGAASADQRDRLHGALVQLLLRDVRPDLGIDGVINRSPCGGLSCPALITAWRRGETELDYPVPSAPSAAEIGVAERLLVLRALEST